MTFLRTRLHFLVTFSCLNVLVFTADVHADLITNGDFEVAVTFNGTGGGWTTSGLDFAGGWRNNGGNPDGNVILNSNGSAAADPVIQQSVGGLQIGQEYLLSFDYAVHVNSSGANGMSFGVFVDDQTDASLLDVSKAIFFGENLTATYQTESATFVATATSHELFFIAEVDNRLNGGLSNSDVSHRLDNVSLVANVPEPSAVVLALPAALMLIRRRR